MIKVLVADPDPLFSESLATALAHRADLTILAERPQFGEQAIETALRLKPNVALVDYWIRGIEGPAVTAGIASRGKKVKVILLAWFYGQNEVKNALAAGAVGFVAKSQSVDELADAIDRVHAGEPPRYTEEMQEMISNAKASAPANSHTWKMLARLTPQEVRILRTLAAGRSIEELAGEFSITPATVRTHLAHIFEKTGTRTHAEALALVRKYGFIPG